MRFPGWWTRSSARHLREGLMRNGTTLHVGAANISRASRISPSCICRLQSGSRDSKPCSSKIRARVSSARIPRRACSGERTIRLRRRRPTMLRCRATNRTKARRRKVRRAPVAVAAYEEHLKRFVQETDRAIDLLASVLPEIAALDDQDTLTYLHVCISTKRHPVSVPDIPANLQWPLGFADLFLAQCRCHGISDDPSHRYELPTVRLNVFD
jgi:hypothetical protein